MLITKSEFFDELEKFYNEIAGNVYFYIVFDNYNPKGFKAFYGSRLEKTTMDIEGFKTKITDKEDNFTLIDFTCVNDDTLVVKKRYSNEFSENKANEIYECFLEYKKNLSLYGFYQKIYDKDGELFVIKRGCLKEYLDYLNNRYQKEFKDETGI